MTRRCCRAGLLSEILQTTRHQGCPARLMARPQATAMLAMEVFVEQHEMALVQVGSKTPIVPMARSAAMLVREKEAGQACCEGG